MTYIADIVANAATQGRKSTDNLNLRTSKQWFREAAQMVKKVDANTLMGANPERLMRNSKFGANSIRTHDHVFL